MLFPVHALSVSTLPPVAITRPLPGVKVSRNAPERRSGARKFRLGEFRRNVRYCAQQVSNFRYSNPTVNESFKFHILRSQIHTVERFYKILQNCQKTYENHA